MTLDTVSDLTRDILELADNDITDKVRATVNLSLPSGYTQSYLKQGCVKRFKNVFIYYYYLKNFN